VKQPLYVVSGLPRSGTSLLMGALAAGGLPIVSDGIRKPDQHNTNGYFEYEPVKKLSEDAGWLFEHRGHAVKIIYRLLYFLPPELPCVVLFMERSLSEVVASQNKMLGKADEPGRWVSLFKKELDKVKRWVSRQTNIRLLEISHRELIRQPPQTFTSLTEVLDLPLDVEAMTATVKPELYRERH